MRCQFQSITIAHYAKHCLSILQKTFSHKSHNHHNNCTLTSVINLNHLVPAKIKFQCYQCSVISIHSSEIMKYRKIQLEIPQDCIYMRTFLSPHYNFNENHTIFFYLAQKSTYMCCQYILT